MLALAMRPMKLQIIYPGMAARSGHTNMTAGSPALTYDPEKKCIIAAQALILSARQRKELPPENGGADAVCKSAPGALSPRQKGTRSRARRE